MIHIEDILLHAVAQKGDKYIFGAEAKASDPNPSAFDCSELVEWSSHRAGLSSMPDGAFNQWRYCANLPLSMQRGMSTRGALLFVGDGTGTGRDAITHVAFSLGNGLTIEARGSKWGVGTWPSVRRFDYARLIPNVDYSPRAQIPTDAITNTGSLEEPDMKVDYVLYTDTSGNKHWHARFGIFAKHVNLGSVDIARSGGIAMLDNGGNGYGPEYQDGVLFVDGPLKTVV